MCVCASDATDAEARNALASRGGAAKLCQVIAAFPQSQKVLHKAGWAICNELQDYETQYVEAGCLVALSTCLDENIRSMAAASSWGTLAATTPPLWKETNGASARFQVYCRAALMHPRHRLRHQTRAGDVARVRTLLEKAQRFVSHGTVARQVSGEALQKLGASGNGSSTVPEGT